MQRAKLVPKQLEEPYRTQGNHACITYASIITLLIRAMRHKYLAQVNMVIFPHHP